MRFVSVIAAALMAGVASAQAASPSPETPVASDAARCIALHERMPEVTAGSRKMFGELAKDGDPELVTLANAILKMLDAMDEMKPLMDEGNRLQRAELLEATRGRLPEREKASAAAIMDAELNVARREYAAINLSTDQPDLQSQIDALKAEFDQRCDRKRR
jgi:hypothetical protein